MLCAAKKIPLPHIPPPPPLPPASPTSSRIPGGSVGVLVPGLQPGSLAVDSVRQRNSELMDFWRSYVVRVKTVPIKNLLLMLTV